MPRFNAAESANSNIQPGRVMIVLKDAIVMDDVIREIAQKYGDISGMHRPESNPKLCFVQYANPDNALVAIEKLPEFPLFRDVDHARKSERYQENHPNDQNQNQNQKRQQNKQSNQNRNDGRNSGNLKRNDGGFNNRNSDMDSPPRQAPVKTQPEIPLGCWYCTKMPNFECRCGAFYCDIECQRLDWAKHKDICMPRLVPISHSNKLILQEAVASKNSSSISSTPYSPSSPEYSGNNNSNNRNQQQQRQQQQKQQQQQTRYNNGGNDFNNQQQQQQYQRNNQQQNVQNRLAAANGPRQNSQQQQQQQNGHDKAGSSNQQQQQQQVNDAASKLQRMKLNKAGPSSSPGRKQILEPGRFPAEGSRVKITTSLPSGVLYIYHNNGQHGAQSDFQTLINRLTQAVESDSRPLQAAPKLDDVVFAPFQDMFYRGKVLAVKGDKIDVQFPDFGNLDTVAWKKCREITNEEVKWAKYLSFPVTLEGVDGPLSKEQKQLVEQLEFEEDFELVKADAVGDSDVRLVVLKRERQNATLNMALVERKEKELRQRRQREEQQAAKERMEKVEQEKKEVAAKIVDPAAYKPFIFDDVITAKQLTADKRHRLCIIDASEVFESGLISVIATEDAAHYAAVVEDCERYGQADPNEYQPTVQGEVCLGRYKADWSRVLYDDEENSLLLDVGTMVTPDEFRRFPPGLSRTLYNNEVFVENMPLLEKMMADGKPESIHGNTIDAWVAVSDNKEDGPLGIRIIPGGGN